MDAKARVGAGGLGCEPASAASVAGAKRLREEGVIAPRDRVVCILTGHQLKDPTATVAYHGTDQENFEKVLGSRGVRRAGFANRPVVVPNDLDDIIRTIAVYPSVRAGRGATAWIVRRSAMATLPVSELGGRSGSSRSGGPESARRILGRTVVAAPAGVGFRGDRADGTRLIQSSRPTRAPARSGIDRPTIPGSATTRARWRGRAAGRAAVEPVLDETGRGCRDRLLAARRDARAGRGLRRAAGVPLVVGTTGFEPEQTADAGGVGRRGSRC